MPQSTDFGGSQRRKKSSSPRKNETLKRLMNMFNTAPENASEIVTNKWLQLGPINLNKQQF